MSWNNYPGQQAHRPPPGPPPGQYTGWAPPPGPPPPGGSPGGFTMPTPSAGGGYGAPSPYAPPGGPPPTWGGAPQGSSFAPPSGPPPSGYGSPYRPPPGPPTTGYGAPSPGYGAPSPGYGAPAPGYQPTPYHPQAQPSGPAHMPPAQQQNYGPQYQGSDNQVHQPWFQYSQCTGKKKALCIGINYFGTSSELAGCHNDARNVERFLCQRYGYKQDDIVVLLDGLQNPRQWPTKANIINAMQWLVRDARPNDSLFFHYSGHGGQTKDLDGDEADGYDETIYPVDFETAGHILDDEMHAIMVQSLPPGCRLTAIFDCCHSGSALDLPYIYSTEGKIKEPNLAAEAGQGLLGTVTSYARGDMSGVFKGVSGLVGLATGSNKKADDFAKRTKTSPADVISWSGCKDTQTSADTQEAGQATGAMSWAFIESLSMQPQQTYQQLLNSIRDLLRTKYSQKPQLSSSHPMDVNVIFIA